MHLGEPFCLLVQEFRGGCQDTATACAAAGFGFPGKVSLQYNPEMHLQLAGKYPK